MLGFVFRLFGEKVTAAFAAKIMGDTIPPQSQGLVFGNQYMADRVFDQHVLGIGFFAGVPIMNPIREMRPLGEVAGLVEPSKRK